MASKAVKDAIESAVENFISIGDPVILSNMQYLKTSNYTEARKFPRGVDEFISTRFPGSAIIRNEIGGTSDDRQTGENLYTEDASFRIDVFVRVSARTRSGNQPPSTITYQDRLYDIIEGVRTAFLGKTFDNVEIFGVQSGMGRPDDADLGWWADSLSFQYHFEHLGP